MDLGTNIANLFRTSANSQPSTATGQPVGGTPAPGGMPAAAPNPGADPANQIPGGGGTAAATPDNPLDVFKDTFTITDDDLKKRPADPFAEPLLNFDPKKFGEAASKMNFAAGISPEDLQKAFPGADHQVATQILNRVAQSSFVSVAQVFTGILDRAVKTNNGRFEKSLAGKFKDLQLSSQTPSNPALKHPAVQPMLAAVRASIAAKNPELSAADIAAKAEEYFSVVAAAMIPPEGSGKSGSAAGGDEDWTKFLFDGSSR